MSYLLQVEHPSTDVEQQWRKAVSLQRKRAVMACFRMIPVYNLSRSFIHLPFNTAPTHTHTRLMALCPGLPGSACTRKVKPIWILLKQETVSGSGISWAVCTAIQTDNHSITPPLSFLQAWCPSYRPTNSFKALKAYFLKFVTLYKLFLCVLCFALCALFHSYRFLCIARVWWVIIKIYLLTY